MRKQKKITEKLFKLATNSVLVLCQFHSCFINKTASRRAHASESRAVTRRLGELAFVRNDTAPALEFGLASCNTND